MSAEVIAERLSAPRDSKCTRITCTRITCTWIGQRDMPAHRVGRLWRAEATEVDDRGGHSDPGETVTPARKRAR